MYIDYQTVQVSRFQRDPPDFTRSIPFPDAPPSRVYKIPRLILFLEASRTIGANTCVPSVHACILYCIYCTTILSNRGNARSFVAQRIQCTCTMYIHVYDIFNYVASKSRVTAGSLRGMVANLDSLRLLCSFGFLCMLHTTYYDNR